VKTVALVYGERRRAAFVHGGTGVFAECGVAFACSKTDTQDEVLFVRLSLNALFRTSGRKIKQWVLTSNDSGSERYVLGDGSSCRDGAVQYGASVNGSFGGSDGQGLRCTQLADHDLWRILVRNKRMFGGWHWSSYISSCHELHQLLTLQPSPTMHMARVQRVWIFPPKAICSLVMHSRSMYYRVGITWNAPARPFLLFSSRALRAARRPCHNRRLNSAYLAARGTDGEQHRSCQFHQQACMLRA
jgi:hypothetical protein